MNLKDITSISCYNCHKSYDDSKSGTLLPIFICNCSKLSIIINTDNEYYFYLNLMPRYLYQIQMHRYLNNQFCFKFISYNNTINPASIESRYILNLNYVPSNLDWQNPKAMIDRLLSLFTFT